MEVLVAIFLAALLFWVSTSVFVILMVAFVFFVLVGILPTWVLILSAIVYLTIIAGEKEYPDI